MVLQLKGPRGGDSARPIEKGHRSGALLQLVSHLANGIRRDERIRRRVFVVKPQAPLLGELPGHFRLGEAGVEG